MVLFILEWSMLIVLTSLWDNHHKEINKYMYGSAQHISWSILIRRYERPSMYKTITEHYTAYNNEQWYLKHYFIARDQSEHNVKQ